MDAAWFLLHQALVFYALCDTSPVQVPNITAYCGEPLGVSDGRIPDSSLTAYSVYNHEWDVYGAHRARLHQTSWPPGYRAENSPTKNKYKSWLKIDLGEEWVITGIATQGYGDSSVEEWVTMFELMYATEADFASTRAIGGKNRTFVGNSDSNTVKFNPIPLPAIASSVTLQPQAWHGNIGLRVELYGCKPGFRFTARVLLLKFPFVVPYFDVNSTLYQALVADIRKDIEFMLRNAPGFLLAEVKRLRPKNEKEVQFLQTEAEIEIQCIENTAEYIKEKLKSEIEKEGKGDTGLLDPAYVKFSRPENKDDCRIPKIKVHLGKTLNNVKTIFTIDAYNITADVSSKCKTQMTLEWKVYPVFTSQRILAYPIFLSNEKNLIIKPHKLPPSLLYVRYTEETHLAYDYGLIRIALPRLVADITGASRITKGNGTIIIDGSKSYDPDPTEKGMLKFTWYCKQKEESFKQHMILRNEIEIFTPRYWTILPVDSPFGRPYRERGCFGWGPGRLSSESSQLKVDVNRMKSKRSYVFRLVITKGKRQTSIEHELQLDPAVNFTVRCLKNCAVGSKLSQTKRISLTSTCTGINCAFTTKHRWVMFKETQNRRHETIWQKVKGFSPRMLNKQQNDAIIIDRLSDFQEFSVRNQRLKIRAIAQLSVNGYDIEEESDVTFIRNSPPYHPRGDKGCRITPEEGKALSKKFTIECKGWEDEDGVAKYEYRYQRANSVVIIAYGEMNRTETRLPLGDISEEFWIPIEVRVFDTMEDFTSVKLGAKVGSILYQDVSKQMHEIAAKQDDIFSQYLNQNKSKHAAEMAIALLSLIDKSGEGTKDKDSTKMNAKKNAELLRRRLAVSPETASKLKDSIIDQMEDMPIDSLQHVTQIVSLVNLATGQKEELSLITQEKSLDMLTRAMDYMRSRMGNDTLTELEQNIANSFLTSMSNLLTVLSDGALMFAKGPKYSIQQLRKSKELTKKAVLQLRKLGNSILRTKVLDEDPSVYSSRSISLILSKNSPSSLEGMSGRALKTSNNEVNFPALGGVMEMQNISRTDTLQSKIIMFAENPFTWHKSNLLVKSWAIDISLYTGLGKYLSVNNLTKPVGIFIPEDTPYRRSPTEHYFIKPTHNISAIENIRYHRFNIPNSHSTVSIKLFPSRGKRLEVFIGARERPLPWNSNYSTIIPDRSKCARTSAGLFNCRKDAYEVQLSSNLTGFIGVHFIGIRYFVQSRGRRSLCGEGKRHRRSICIGVKEKPTMPVPTKVIRPRYNATTDVNYNLSISLSSCMYWSEREDRWTQDGCKPGPLSEQGKVHCLCNHLSSFGGDFFVEPNPIDFDKVYLALVNPKVEDFVVMTTVIGILILYLITLLFARRADKKDEIKRVPNVFLSDRGDFLYKISVFTGMWKGSGTTANVGLVMYGESSYTDTISLNDTTINKTFFARGSTNTFYLYLPKNLGPVYKIRIWHDNEGRNPAWFLREVTITDVSKNMQWHFLCNKWLALEKGDGEIETEISAAEKKEIQSFKNVFHSRVSRSLADSHLWASVFMRPPQTVFTRVQRLSCCLSILFATMVTNAMFYQFGTKPLHTFQIGPLKVSWMQVRIGLQSALIAIPVNAVVVTIFRNVRPSEDSDNSVSTREGVVSERRRGLPHGFVYLGWLLCLSCAIGSAVVTVLYSLSWGGETANEWLTSIMVSFFQDVLVTQPIKVVLLASLLALILKKPPKPDDVHGSPHWKNRLRDKKCLPPAGDKLERARLVNQQLLKTVKVILEILTYVIFATLLFIVCYGNRKEARFHMKDELSKLFGNFESIKDVPSFWKWTDSELLPGLYNVQWYNGEEFAYKEGFLKNRENFLVGMPRLRQLRIKQAESCVAAEESPLIMRNISRCIPQYSPSVEEVAPYHTIDWTPVYNISSFESSFELSEICPRPWRYQSPRDLNTMPYSGFYTSYSGGGFVADLGYNMKSANAAISALREHNWIDNRTSAVFVEFTVFEPVSLLITAVKLLYERLPTGGVRCTTRIEALTVYTASDPGFRPLYQTSQLLFIGVVVFLSVCECVKAYKRGCSYFCRFWSWMDIILMCSSLLAMGTLFFKEKYVSEFIRGVQENPFKTTSTDFIVLWSQLEVYLLAFVIFVVTIKFLRLIRFNSHIGQLMGTLRTSFDNLVSFYIVLGVILAAFSEVGMLVFGRNLEAFSTFLGATSVILQKLLGTSMQMKKVQSINPLLGCLYVFAYSLAVALILLNVFLSILNTAYKETRESGKAKRKVKIHIRKYIKDSFKRWYREFREDFKGLMSKLKFPQKKSFRFQQSMKMRIDGKQFMGNYKGNERTAAEERRLMSPVSHHSVRSHASIEDNASIASGPLDFMSESQIVVPEDLYEFEPCFERVEEMAVTPGGDGVPLASFDEEDDICSFIDDLITLDDIRASLIQIERDLIRATNRDEDDIFRSEEMISPTTTHVSLETFAFGSLYSISLSMKDEEHPEYHEEENGDPEFEDYSGEEYGIDDEGDEDDMNMYESKSPVNSNFGSMTISIQGEEIPEDLIPKSYNELYLVPPLPKW